MLFFPHMTVEENIIPLKMKKLKYSSARTMIEEALSVNMNFGKTLSSTTFGGQRHEP